MEGRGEGYETELRLLLTLRNSSMTVECRWSAFFELPPTKTAATRKLNHQKKKSIRLSKYTLSSDL